MITAHVPPFATVDRKPEPRPVTAELRNVTRRASGPWRDYDHLSGDIYNDSRGRSRDGTTVSTSEIVSVDGEVFTTRNSVYRVASWAGKAPANDNADGVAVAEPVGGVQSPDERPGDYLMAGDEAPASTPTDDRYAPPVKADLVTFWMRGDAAIMSVVSEGKVKDYEVPMNVLAAGARYAIERLMMITTGRAA